MKKPGVSLGSNWDLKQGVHLLKNQDHQVIPGHGKFPGE